MAIICRNHNLLFIMTPRTACSAIGELLCSRLNGEYIPQKDILDENGIIRVQKKHSTLKEILNLGLLRPEEIDNLVKFCTVRNPYDSLVSLYIKKKYKYQHLLDKSESWVHKHPAYKRDMQFAKKYSFNTWLIKHIIKNFAKRFIGRDSSMYGNYTNGVDYVIRYENLEEDFSNILKKAGVKENLKIPVVNKTDERKSGSYKNYYSIITRIFVGMAYRKDMKKFRYKF